MMGQDLEDLVIDENIRRNNKKGKGILTILALLIAILIIVIMMAKMVMGEDNPDVVAKKSDEASLISSELLLDDEDSNKDSKSDNENLDDITKSLINNKNSSKTNEIKEDTVEVNDEKEVEKPKPVEEPKREKIVKEEKPKSKPKVEEKPKPKPKPVEKKREEKRVEKRVEKPKNHSSQGSYYIQVGSFSQKPSNRFLSVITNSGFTYKLHSSGKLLIGSYSSRADANSDLPRVKDRINKSAFVIKIKQ